MRGAWPASVHAERLEIGTIMMASGAMVEEALGDGEREGALVTISTTGSSICLLRRLVNSILEDEAMRAGRASPD